jgi:outer membrane receptor protein involved in Fe transport
LYKWKSKKGFAKNLITIAGIAGNKSVVKGELYGDRNAYNYAPYAQVEKKVGRAWFSAGARYEVNQMDTQKQESKPIYRAGINFEATSHTFLRMSWGQGYRFPTIAERFIKTNFGAASVFPNPGLQSETGQSAEIGIKQGIKLGKWTGVADIAGFWMRYYNMIEFNFGYSYPTEPGSDSSLLKNLGFKSLNIGDTEIKGVDVSLQAAKSGKLEQTLLLGYTYILPTQLNPDSFIWANYSTDRNILKYRYQHSIKGSWSGVYKKWSFGLINTVTSPMVNIDEIFENTKPTQNFYGLLFDISTQLPGTIRKYRNEYNKWIWIGDARLGYQIHKKHRIALVVKNLANQEYYSRPALIGAPQSFTVQFFSEF